jgi:hypothetical protein
VSDDYLRIRDLDLTLTQDRRLREALTVYIGHDGCECVDARLWLEWHDWILDGPGGDA